jgi:dGTPase
MKVAQVGRRLAQALKAENNHRSRPARRVTELDEDAVEAACLAHDLGHPPFGHIAESELNRLASGWGGFEGNAQSFRILTKLALRDLRRPGLNLTRTTLNGVLKYPWLRNERDARKQEKWGAYTSEEDAFDWVREGEKTDSVALEAQIMDWADDVTYAVHDLEDFYRVGLVPLDLLARDEQELGRFRRSLFKDDEDKELNDRLRREGFTKNGVIETTEFLFGLDGFVAADRYRGTVLDRVTTRARSSALIDRYINAVTIRTRPTTDQSPIRIEERLRTEVAILKELTWFYVIKRPSLETLHHGQGRVIRHLHRIYVAAARSGDLALFPTAQRDQLVDAPGELRVVTDFVAGLTEEMAYELHHRLTGEAKGSILDAAAASFA